MKKVLAFARLEAYGGKSKEENCYLKKIEESIKRHPESGSDYGVCPECISKNHPELSDKMHQETGKRSLENLK